MRGDLQQAYDEAKKGGRLNPLMGKGVYDFLEKQLLDDEKVVYIAGFNVGIVSAGEAIQIKPLDIKNKTAGVFALTNKRVLHCSKIAWNTKVEQVALSNINNVESKGGLLFSVLRIQSTSNVMEVDVPTKESNAVLKIVIDAFEKAKNPATPQVTLSDSNDAIEKIKQLAQLRDSGFLTEDEFSKKKEELLKRV